MKSILKFTSLIVLVFLFFVSCDFLDVTEDSDLPIKDWEVYEVYFYKVPLSREFRVYFSGCYDDLTDYEYYMDFDCTKPVDIPSLMVIPGVSYGPGWGFESGNGLWYSFGSGPEITENTVATFNNEWMYLVEVDGNIFTPRKKVGKARIITKSMGITVIEVE